MTKKLDMKTKLLIIVCAFLFICDTANLPAQNVRRRTKSNPVNILVKRTIKYDVCTEGELYVNGEYFCKTLELRFDNAKKDSSSIPVGTYNANIKYSTMKNRWVIELENIYPHVYYKVGNEWKMKTIVRNFVQIHAGDYSISPGENLLGCILVGNNNDGCEFTNSKTTMNKLLKDYFDDDSKPNENTEITVTVQIDY